jgi:protein O-mannosyl-transferase
MARRKPAAAARAPRPRESPAPTPFRTAPLWISLALAMLTVVVYAPVRTFQFVNWDDPGYVTENATVQQGLTWESVTWAVTTGHSPYWHPVTWLTHLADVQLYGLEAGGHHVTNLVFHVANVVLLFLLLRRLTGAAGPGAFVAAMFAVHPLHVESVAWVTERKDVLSGFFWILTIWAYARYVERRDWRRYAAVLGLYLLALMSKPMVVTLPVVLLLLDWWPLGSRSTGRLPVTRDAEARGGGAPRAIINADRASELPLTSKVLIDKLPLFAMAIGTGIATIVIQKQVGAVAGLDVLPFSERLSNAIVGCAEYLWKTIWPARLAPFYPIHHYPIALVATVALALAAVTAFAFRLRHSRPWLLVGWGWYLVTIAPIAGLVQVGEQRIADRFMYIPIIGVLVIVAWGFAEMVTRARVATAAALLVVGVSAVTARAQVAHWTDSFELWDHSTRVTPDSYIAFEKRGEALRDRGAYAESIASYQRALALAPPKSPGYLGIIHNSIGMVLARQGKTGEAHIHFAEAVRFSPNFAEARSNFGNALAVEGRFDEAIEQYRAAVLLKPDFTEAQVGLGGALLSLRRGAEAAPRYEEALRVNPNLAEAHNGLGAALAMQGRDADAMAQYVEALRLKPDLPTAHLNIAVVLIKQGKLDEARTHLTTALSIDPAYAPARQLLERLPAR